MIKHFFISEAQHMHALLDHVCIAILIVVPLLVGRMNIAITLNYKLSFTTVKISNIVTELMLSSELQTMKLAITQMAPEQNLSRRAFLSEFTRRISQASRLITTTVMS